MIDVSKYQEQNSKAEKKSTDLFAVSGILSKEISFGSGQLSDKRKDRFFFELFTLLRSRLDLKRALDLMTLQGVNEQEGKVVQVLKELVIAGESLAIAMQKCGKFSEYDFFTVQIGEETGNLAIVLEELANYYNRKVLQKRKIMAALTYPLLVLSTSAGAVFFMLHFVVPMFNDVFKRFGGKLPWMTQMVITMSAAFSNLFLPLLALLMALVYVFFRLRNKVVFRKYSAAVVLKIPVLGNLVEKVYLARFCNTMKLLISTKIPLLRAIALTEKTISFYPIERSLQLLSHEIMCGRPLYECLNDFSIYPQKLIQLIKIGEEINQLDYFFENIAEQYVAEVAHQADAISKLIEPLIIIFLGLVVGFILIAMYLPMFQMSNNF